MECFDRMDSGVEVGDQLQTRRLRSKNSITNFYLLQGRNSAQSLFTSMMILRDKFSVRGIVYALLSSLGLGYEMFFVYPSRSFLITMYSIVIVVGFFLILFVKDERHEK